MECLYIPEFDRTHSHIAIPEDEARHCRSLRLRPGDRVMVSNGRGTSAVATLGSLHDATASLTIVSVHPQYHESERKFSLAIGMLDNKDRMEFALEKAVELGVEEISILRTRFSSQKPLHMDRTRAKLISAMKQCKRSVLPQISVFTSIQEACVHYNSHTLIIADTEGNSVELPEGSAAVFVGPEGGFHPSELQILHSQPHIMRWRLGPARLRAETAAIAALSAFHVR